jgi:hypothetical protein
MCGRPLRIVCTARAARYIRVARLAQGDNVVFSDTPISGQFVLSTPGDGSSVPANTITVTFGGTTCPAKATAAVGLL